MFKINFITALRNFRRKPGYTFINFFGLALAITSVMLIAMWVNFQLSYDKFNTNYEKIYQVNAEVHWGDEPSIQSNIQASVAPAVQRLYPEVKYVSRVNYTGDNVIKYNDKVFYEDNIMIIDSSFFDIFSFPIIAGSKEKFFSDPYSIFLTESMVKKYFNNEDPLGKTIHFDQFDMTVTGILKDAPANSSFQFDFLISFDFQKIMYRNPNMDNNWRDWYLYTYLILDVNTDPEAFNAKFATLYDDHPEIKAENKPLIYPFKEMRLRPPWSSQINFGLLDGIYLMSFIAFLILIVACVNFMNLSTASFSGRAKDVGIRKAIGAKRKVLFNQFMTESLILSIAGGLLALLLVKLLIPVFNLMLDERIPSNIFYLKYLLIFGIIVIFSGLLAGSYPSFYLSSYKPVKVLQGKPLSKKGKNTTRSALVIFQFCVAIFLIVSSIFSIKQMKYLLNKDLGFKKDQVIYVKLNNPNQYHNIKQELLKNSNVQAISGANWWGFNNMNNSWGYDYEGKPENFDVLLTHQIVDYDYIETLGIEMVDGRSFSKDFPADNRAFILNEEAIRTFGIENPVGKPFTMHGRRGTIIGIMKNANLRNLYNNIDPRIIWITDNNFSCVLIRLSESGNNNTESVFKKIRSIEKDWIATVPDIPFDYQFVNDMYNETYNYGRYLNRLLTVFAVIAIVISCIGLFGLAIYSTEQRTKEIGVRKVNGAKISQVITLLLNEFFLFVIIAFVLIVPVTYFFVGFLLKMYSYQTEMSWWVYIFSGFLVLIIALITVGMQSLQAARRNPVEALRYE